MDLGSCSPPEQEEADCGTEAGEEGWDEHIFGVAEASCSESGHEDLVDVPVVDEEGDGGADDDGKKCESHFAEVEAVKLSVDDGEGLEKGVVDAVGEGGVAVQEEDGRVEEGDFERDEQRFTDHGVEGDMGLGDLGCGAVCVRACWIALLETSCASV